MPDADEESNPTSLALDESDAYLTKHLTPHISATSRHLIGAPEHPEPPYEPSFYPPTGYWSSAEKALFFRALSAHSRLRPDVIAASIGTKSTADVVIYLSLLREGAARAKDSDIPAGIPRDRHPAAYQVSSELIAFEEQHAARICAAEPTRAMETVSMVREEVVHTMQTLPEGDRADQSVREGAHELWTGEQDIEWARKDLIARLDVVGLQVLDRILRRDEERRAEPRSVDDEEMEEVEDHARGRHGPLTTLHSAASASSQTIQPQATTPNASSPLVVPIPDDDVEDAPGTIRSDLSPTSRRRIYKRLHMRRKRAEASGGIARLNPARLKPGRKVSASSKFKMPHVKDEDENLKRRERGDTRPYKMQHEFEQLGIDAEYLRANALGLFHLGALGRLMRLYPSLDASRPSGVAESIAVETIQMLHALVVRFVRLLVQRAITVRELDFALRAHTKVWRLGDRVVRPPHVRRALELSGCDRLSKRAHFERLLERFPEDKDRLGDGGEDDEHGKDEGNDDVLQAARATTRDGEAIAEQEDDNDDEGQGKSNSGVSDAEQQQQQEAGKDAQVHESAEVRWSMNHRAMYSPFVCAPDMIAPSHPFGVYATGTTPESLRFSTHARHVIDQDEDEGIDENEDDLMPAETDDEALAVELLAEERLDEADAREDAAFEANVWGEFGGAHDTDVLLPAPTTLGKRSAREEVGGNDDALPRPARKRGKRSARGGCTPVGGRAKASSVKSVDGGKVKSTPVIEHSDLEYLD